MTDLELNIAIVEAMGLKKDDLLTNNANKAGLCWYKQSDGGVRYFDYKNWNDIMPLCVKHCIFENPTVIREMIESETKKAQRVLAKAILEVLEGKWK